jgi:hypothetical protein
VRWDGACSYERVRVERDGTAVCSQGVRSQESGVRDGKANGGALRRRLLI